MLYMILLIATFIIIISSLRITQNYNDNYISIETTKCEKGMAAILIVFHHISQNIEINKYCMIMRYIGFIMVAVFFFCSGYGLAYGVEKKSNYLQNFFRKRILSVLIPYWMIYTVMIIYDTCKGKYFTPIEYILSFIGGEQVTGSWFVPSILILYCIFWGVFTVIKNNYWCSVGLLVVAIVIYMFICSYMGLITSYTASVSAFVLGVVWIRIKDIVIPWIRKNYFVKLILISLIFGIVFSGRLLLALKGFDNEIVHVVLRNLASAFFIMWLIVITQKVRFKGYVLPWLGEISYELYLVHGVLVVILSRDNPYLYIVRVLLGGIIGGIILHKVSVWTKRFTLKA